MTYYSCIIYFVKGISYNKGFRVYDIDEWQTYTGTISELSPEGEDARRWPAMLLGHKCIQDPPLDCRPARQKGPPPGETNTVYVNIQWSDKNQPENKIQIQENGQNMPEDRTRYKPVNRLTRPDKWRYPTHKCPKQNPSPIGWKKEQCELKMTPVMCEIFWLSLKILVYRTRVG